LVNQLAGKDKGFAKRYGNKTLRVGLAIAYARKGLQGDWKFLEHLEGMPPQPIEHSGEITTVIFETDKPKWRKDSDS